MHCPPPLDPIPIVFHVGDFRLQHERTETRALWVVDETSATPLHWWSKGQVTFQNLSNERRRIRYRRRVRVLLPESINVSGWTEHCCKGGTLALTCTVVLDPGTSQTVFLEAESIHSTRFIQSSED